MGSSLLSVPFRFESFLKLKLESDGRRGVFGSAFPVLNQGTI
jgi:hypothetical protein